MARVQTGTIITDVAGSVGGNTFRRSCNGLVLQKRANRSRSHNNSYQSSLITSARILKHWSQLSLSERNAWSEISNKFLYPDRFGVMRSLPANQFYLKSNYWFYDYYQHFLEADNFSEIIPDFTISNFNYVDNSHIYISVSNFSTNFIIGFQVLQLPFEKNSVKFDSSYMFRFLDINSNGTYNLINVSRGCAINLFPHKFYAIQLTIYNPALWITAKQQFTFQT